MSSLPWSAKGTKAIPVDADKFMLIDSEVAPGPDQNKTTTLAGILSSFSSSHILLFKDQADLEDEFGSDIIIPAGESWTLIALESFTLTKPIKIALGSFLDLRAAAASTLATYTGTGDMLQNENPANLINTLRVKDIGLFSEGPHAIFDIKATGLVRLEQVNIVKFESVGTIEATFVDIPSSGVFDVNEGLILVEPQGAEIKNFSHAPPSPRDYVHITIISTGNPTINVSNCSVFNTSADVVFFDPSSGSLSDYTIENTKGFFNSLFVPGVDNPVTMVSDAAGQARFAAASHGYVVGDRIVHSGFSESSYNGTFIVGSVPTASEYMTGVAFNGNSSGNTTKAGRDSTDVNVRAINNKGTPDGMFTGDSGLETFAVPQTVIINTISVPEVITNAGWAFSNLERFSEGVSNQGQLIADDAETRKYRVFYSGTLEKVAGGATDIGIVLLKNGIIIGFNPPHTDNSNKVQISASDIIELGPTDTLDIAVVNYANTDNISVSQAGIVVSLG